MGLLATGVAVVIAHAGEEPVAMTVNAVTSVSLDPMLVLFCPGKQTRFAGHIEHLEGFTINKPCRRILPGAGKRPRRRLFGWFLRNLRCAWKAASRAWIARRSA